MLLGAGGLLIVIGIVGMLSPGRGTSGETATPDTTTTVELVTTTTTTVPRETTTTAVAVTTTAAPATTTTTVDLVSAIDAFVPTFADAIARGDVDFLYESLHPIVTDLFDEELCRSFIEAEILLLEDYRLIGDVTGPETENIGGQAIDAFTGPVGFGFQGEEFESNATFAYEEGVRWFTECR